MSTVTTVGDLAARVHRIVKGSRRETVNYLEGAITDAATDIVLADDVEAVTVGSHLGIDEEILYVRSVAAATKTVTVRRGMFNTTPAAHADDTEVEVDWRWFTADVVDALSDELRSWGDDVFRVRTVDVSVGEASTAYDVALTGFRYPLKLRRSATGFDRWLDVVGDYRVETGLPTTSFASGNALFLPSSYRGSGTVRLEYAADFVTATLAADTTLAAIGLGATLIDAALYGAASRLLLDREAQRSAVESQPEPRQAADVRAGHAMQTGAVYRQMADQRLADEAFRLRARYPFRRT